MKSRYGLLVLLSCIFSFSQQQNVFQENEKLVFDMSYGFINAGKAVLELTKSKHKGEDVFWAKGYGYTTGMTKMLFRVEDHYQSYFDTNEIVPYIGVRKIHEGGYERNQHTFFDHENQKAKVKDLIRNTETEFDVPENVQDVVSAFYYLRNHPKISTIKEGESIVLNMFFEDETIKFQLKFLGREIIKTKFGKVQSLVFRPYVQKGRVFKESESLTMWISDDKNKIPLKIKADLLVGSLKAELSHYSGTKYPLGTK